MQRYIDLLNRRIWVIVVATVIAAAVAGIGIYLTPRSYSAAATIRVAESQGGFTGSVDVRYSERLVNTYVQILQSQPVLDEAIQRLKLDMTPKDLLEKIKSEALPDTELIRITASDANPVLARDIANALSDLVVEQGQSLYSGGGRSAREILEEQLGVTESNLQEDRADLESLMDRESSTQGEIDALGKKIALQEQTYAMLLSEYEQARVAEAMRANSITVVDPAITPENPSGPRRLLVIAVGALIGLMGGTALALLLESLDTTLYDVDQLRSVSGLPVLGTIPHPDLDGSTDEEPISIYTSGSSQEEAYRLLRANLLSHSQGAKLTTLLITSAGHEEDNSTVAANLAYAAAQAGRKVVVVDGDLRRPLLHRVFELPNEVGLSTVLNQRSSLEEAMKSAQAPELRVLTSGPKSSSTTELLESTEMVGLVDQLGKDFDLVLMHSPPLLTVADAVVLATLADAAVLVTELGETKQEDVEAALNQMADVEANAIGVIALTVN